MKRTIQFIFIFLSVFACKEDTEKTPYKIENVIIEEVSDGNKTFCSEIHLRGDTINLIFEDMFILKEPLKIIQLEAFHINNKEDLILIDTRMNTYFPEEGEDFIHLFKRCRISLDLLGIVPHKMKINLYCNGKREVITYP